MTRFMTTAAIALVLGAALISSARAQLGFGPQPTFIEGADVWIDGELVRDCNIVFAGKKIKAVGPGIAKPSGARVIDGKGKTIVPAFIDASSSVGLLGTATNRAHHRSIDRADPFDHETYRDALEAGVAYVYLRNGAKSGIGGQGVGLRIPEKSVTSLSALELEATGAIHLAVGSNETALGRIAEIEGLAKQLEAAKKYRESWEKYEEELEKYSEELADWSKKNKKKDSKDKKGSDDKGDKKKWGPEVADHDEDHDHDHHDHDGDDHDHDADHDHDDHAADHDDHGHSHDADDPYAGAPRFALELKRLLSQPSGVGETSPRPSHVDDGTEPHLRWVEDTRPTRGGIDLSQTEIAVCPHCSGIYDSNEPDDHEHDHSGGFDFFQFAPEEKKDDKKSGDKKKDDKKGGKPKLPREPSFDPSREAVADALEGKLRVRIQVHRAEDILAVLALLEEYPMDASLEGVTEGWRVADALAKAGVTVVLHAEPVKPRSETGGGGGMDFPFEFPFPMPFPFPFDFGGGGSGPEGERLEGVADVRNAAILHRAGVPVVVASVGKPASATALLPLSAAFAAGSGLPKGAAIKALTTHAASVLGLGDRLGSITTGHHASFLVLDGDPFAPATSVERVYVDGERIYRKK